MPSFFSKIRNTSSGSGNPANPGKSKKDELSKEATPLEVMLADAGPIRADGKDKFLGLENFGNTCYCNSIVQALYHSEPFRNSVISYPPYSVSDDPAAKRRKVNVSIRPQTVTATSLANKAKNSATQALKQKPGTQQLPAIGVKAEDRPDAPEYKKKHAMLKGPVLDLTKESTGAYGMDECTFTGLKDIFSAMIDSNSRTGVVSPSRFLDVFRRDNEMFQTQMHQDAHEFYGLVLNDVISNVEANARNISEAEEARRRKQAVRDISDTPEQALATAAATQRPLSSTATTTTPGVGPPGTGWIHDIFEGVLTSQTRCLACQTTSLRDETFLDLSINLSVWSSVAACLHNFSSEEMLCELDKFQCDKCGGLQEAEKRMRIKRLPKVLALHLKRFQYTKDYTQLKKLHHQITYPFELRMSNTDDDTDDPDRLYELYAVIIHIGHGPYHGHYVAVIKTPDRGWLLFDDEMVEPVDKHFVRNFFGTGDPPKNLACAYVLFYQETTFEKISAEQEAEGVDESGYAQQDGDLPLGTVRENGDGDAASPLSRLVSAPPPTERQVAFSPLAHAVTTPAPSSAQPHPSAMAPSSTLDPIPYSVPLAPAPPANEPIPNPPASNAKPTREERKAIERAAKEAEKARKQAEKDLIKEKEARRKEKAVRYRENVKQEADDMAAAIAASKADTEGVDAAAAAAAGPASNGDITANGRGTDEPNNNNNNKKKAKERTISDAGSNGTATSSGFLSRSGRGSKSLSRKSFAWLKDRRASGSNGADSATATTTTTTTGSSSNGKGKHAALLNAANGSAAGPSTTNGSVARVENSNGSAAMTADDDDDDDTATAEQGRGEGIPPLPPTPSALKTRFSVLGLGRKRSNNGLVAPGSK